MKKEDPIDSIQTIKFFAKNQRNYVEIAPNDLFYIKALRNYLEIHYKQNETVKQCLLRNTIKSISKALFSEYNLFKQCHKSYIINTRHIETITGNSQGYKIKLKHCTHLIPVSRTYKYVVYPFVWKVN